MTDQVDFQILAQHLAGYSKLIRRDLHQHPEMGFEEFRTAGIVASELSNLGLEVTQGVAKTGVIGILEGKNSGHTVLIRCDMDALPITEENLHDFISLNPGIMHACGHDGHVAIGITTARMLSAHCDSLSGTFKFVFQPAEEGRGGAERMIKEGVLEQPHPDFCLAVHLWNDLPVGTVALVPGELMAGSGIFTLRVKGKGGHGGLPHQSVDPIAASAQIITGLQSIISRNVPPLEAAVISVTKINGGQAFNVIPPEVELGGTIRYFKTEINDLIIDRMQSLTRNMAAAMSCTAELIITQTTPPVKNDEKMVEKITRKIRQAMPEIIINSSFQTMVSEDMAFMMQDIPGCYFLVGSANAENGPVYGHHHPKFDIDENALSIGAAVMAYAAEVVAQAD